jgi:hypothetical protein
LSLESQLWCYKNENNKNKNPSLKHKIVKK